MASQLKGHKNGKTTSILPPIGSPVQNDSGANLSKVLVLTKNDLERISHHLNKSRIEEEQAMEEKRRKKELHEKSKALTKNWNNTIQGARRFKLEQKRIREEKLEEKRKAVDLEHAEYLAQERRKALEQAKLLQYHETDNVKTFHSAMKLSEILKEREAQMEMKKYMDHLNKQFEFDLERRNEEIMNTKYQTDDDADRRKAIETYELTEFLKQQINTKKQKENQTFEEKKREAEEMRQLQEQLRLENEQLEELRQQKVKNLRETYNRAFENRIKMQEAEKIMDEEENEDIRVYAAAKMKMARMKREREDAAERKKQEHRDQMMSYLGSLLKTQVENEDFRIAKAVEKQEAKREKEERDKEAKFRREMGEINQHRVDTIKRKELDREAREKEEQELMKKKIEADLAYQQFEHEKGLKNKLKLIEMTEQNVKLINDRKDNEKKVRFADRDFVQKELELIKLEDQQFEDYATRVIDYMKQHGRNTYPMERVLNEVTKKHESDNKSQASLIKKHQNDVPTNKNLGFM